MCVKLEGGIISNGKTCSLDLTEVFCDISPVSFLIHLIYGISLNPLKSILSWFRQYVSKFLYQLNLYFNFVFIILTIKKILIFFLFIEDWSLALGKLTQIGPSVPEHIIANVVRIFVSVTNDTRGEFEILQKVCYYHHYIIILLLVFS